MSCTTQVPGVHLLPDVLSIGVWGGDTCVNTWDDSEGKYCSLQNILIDCDIVRFTMIDDRDDQYNQYDQCM